jgi:type II secretory pathway pseudopilin PulG
LFLKILRGEKGYEVTELLVVVGILGAVAAAVLGSMKLGLNGAAAQVGTKVGDIIGAWTAP